MSYSSHVPGNTFASGVYAQIAEEARDTDMIVEVGVGWGKGTCMMMEALAAFRKSPRFYALELFDMPNAPDDHVEIVGETPWGEPMAQWIKRMGSGARLDSFLFHLKNQPPHIREKLTDWLQIPSYTSPAGVRPGSCSAVLLTASRNPVIFEQELKWWGTLRSGGMLVVDHPDTPVHTTLVSNLAKEMGTTVGSVIRGAVLRKP